MNAERASTEMRGPGDRRVGERGERPVKAGDVRRAVYRLDLVYDGTAFKGWARQPEQRTVEGELEQALATALREPVRLSVAGRTDAGVHALAQVASFANGANVAPERLRLSLNALLPPDIAVTAVSRAAADFVAREAVARTYRYRLWVSPVRPVHERLHVWCPRGAVDTNALQQAAQLLAGRRDFAACTPSARLYRSCVRTVTVAAWRQPPAAAPAAGEEWIFEITADSFVHNMVRVAVGSMVDVAQARLSIEQMAAALESGERWLMGQTAPPRGLALVAVAY
jgi:tRNA pseudouridine38-40 synthase